jgi:hypothetical protein
MEWALERAAGVDAITSYEALLDVQLRTAGDVVVCAYDVRRHRPAVIADMLDVHPYALIEGRLRRRATRRQPRDRILSTASRLFHRHGIAATGIDTVAEWLELDGYRGCPYLHTIAELADIERDNRVRMAATAYLDEVRERLRDAAAAAGADRATGDRLHILLTGAIVLAAASRSSASIETAREVSAQQLTSRPSSKPPSTRSSRPP